MWPIGGRPPNLARFGRIISKSLSLKSPNHLINSAMYSSTLWLGTMRPRLSVLYAPPWKKPSGFVAVNSENNVFTSPVCRPSPLSRSTTAEPDQIV